MNERRETATSVDDGERLTISAFGREARLTLKALRLYDALGLLVPAFVSPESGYRYYGRGQLGRARLIGLLRQLDMPLNRIAEVLDLVGPSAADAVRAYWREVERDAATKRALVSYLEGYLRGKGESMFEVKLREVPEQKVATIQRAVRVRDLPGFIAEAQRDLYGIIARQDARAGKTSLVIYHGKVDEDNDGPVEVCVPFEGSVEPVGELHVHLEGGGRELYTTITKAQCEFPGILEAYDAVDAALGERGLQASAAPREVYFVSDAEVGDEDPFCDIAFPVQS